MLKLMTAGETDPGHAYFAHPFARAPFILVGEGAPVNSLITECSEWEQGAVPSKNLIRTNLELEWPPSLENNIVLRGPPPAPTVMASTTACQPPYGCQPVDRLTESSTHRTASSTFQSSGLRTLRRIDRNPRVCALRFGLRLSPIQSNQYYERNNKGARQGAMPARQRTDRAARWLHPNERIC
jgi:hypothetical protein